MKTPWFPILAALLLATSAYSQSAEKKTKKIREEALAEAEQAVAAEEDKRDGELEKSHTPLKGTLRLSQPGDEIGKSIGTFTVASQTYELKIEQPAMIETLKHFDGAQVSLVGKVRNNGKYFVALSVFETSSAPPKPKRRGL